MKIIKFDINTFEVSLYNDELAMLPCVVEIFKQCDSVDIAYKELGFAWWIGYYNSPGNQAGLNATQLEVDAKHRLGLPNNWSASKAVYDLAILIKDECDFAAVKPMQALRRAFNNTEKIIDKINERVDELLLQDITPELVSNLISYQKDLMNIAADIPKRIETLNKAEAIVKKEAKEVVMARGDKIVTESMIPKIRK